MACTVEIPMQEAPQQHLKQFDSLLHTFSVPSNIAKRVAATIGLKSSGVLHDSNDFHLQTAKLAFQKLMEQRATYLAGLAAR
eukprot:5680934-Amphidinium_carterae.2